MAAENFTRNIEQLIPQDPQVLGQLDANNPGKQVYMSTGSQGQEQFLQHMPTNAVDIWQIREIFPDGLQRTFTIVKDLQPGGHLQTDFTTSTEVVTPEGLAVLVEHEGPSVTVMLQQGPVENDTRVVYRDSGRMESIKAVIAHSEVDDFEVGHDGTSAEVLQIFEGWNGKISAKTIERTVVETEEGEIVSTEGRRDLQDLIQGEPEIFLHWLAGRSIVVNYNDAAITLTTLMENEDELLEQEVYRVTFQREIPFTTLVALAANLQSDPMDIVRASGVELVELG